MRNQQKYQQTPHVSSPGTHRLARVTTVNIIANLYTATDVSELVTNLCFSNHKLVNSQWDFQYLPLIYVESSTVREPKRGGDKNENIQLPAPGFTSLSLCRPSGCRRPEHRIVWSHCLRSLQRTRLDKRATAVRLHQLTVIPRYFQTGGSRVQSSSGYVNIVIIIYNNLQIILIIS